MVKECKIITKNSMVIVVDYDGEAIQFSNKGYDKDTIFVECKDGRYGIVDKPTVESAPEVQEAKSVKSKRTAKKTKVETAEVIELVDNISSDIVMDNEE